MAFADVVFPLQLSRGTSGGAGFRTTVERTDGGYRKSSTAWDVKVSRARWDLSQTVQSESDIATLLSFLRCMRGPATAFRFLDPADHSTRVTHVGLPNPSIPSHRQLLGGTPDGTRTVFQLQKRYTHSASGLSFVRDIVKPIGSHHDATRSQLTIYGGGVALWFEGANLFPTFDITVEYDTGKVRIVDNATGNGPPPGSTLEWSGTFHTPVTFDPAVDDGPEIQWQDADIFNVGNLSVVEVSKFAAEGHEQLFQGGSRVHLPTAGIDPFVIRQGSHWRINTVSGGFVSLPDPLGTFAQPIAPGGPHYIIENVGSTNAVGIVNSAQQFITTLQPGESTELWATGQVSTSQLPPSRQWFAR